MYSALPVLGLPLAVEGAAILPWREEKAAAFDTPTMHNIAELSFIFFRYVGILSVETQRSRKRRKM